MSDEGAAAGVTEKDVDDVIEALRRGESAMTGGSRLHSTYVFRDGAFRSIDFDEGYTEEHDVTEATLRAIIRGRFAEFIPALDAPHWRAHADAVRARDPEAAASALRKLRGGGGLHQIEALLGAWAHPNPPVSAAWIALVRELDRTSTLFHAFMRGVAWDRRPEIAPLARAWLDRVESICGARLAVTREMIAYAWR